MNKKDDCQACVQRHNCMHVYDQLGRAEGPSITSEVSVAFLVPMLLFIGSLCVFEALLSSVFEHRGMRTLFCLILALLAALIPALVVKLKGMLALISKKIQNEC